MQPYRPYLRQPARNLRNNMTEAELKLWSRIRRKQVLGIQFYRQKPIERFIVDFYAPKAGLVIEVDGGPHFKKGSTARDRERDAILEELGLKILRFINLQVLNETEAVVEAIETEARKRMGLENPPQVPLLQRGRSAESDPPL